MKHFPISAICASHFSARRTLVGALAAVVASLPLDSLLAQARPTRIDGLPDGQPILIGVLITKTGPIAAAFAPTFVPLRMAVDNVNANGGILGHQIRLIEVDDEGSPAKQKAAVLKLVSEGVHFIAGPVGTSQNIAAHVAGGERNILRSGYTVGTQLGQPEKFPLYFQFNFNSQIEAEKIIDFLTQTQRQSKIAILRDETGYGDDIEAAARQRLATYKLAPVAVQTFPISAPDLQPYVANLRNSGADAVIFAVAVAGNMLQAMRAFTSLKWYPMVGTRAVAFTPAILKEADPQFLSRAYGLTPRAGTFTDSEGISSDLQRLADQIIADPVGGKAAQAALAGPFHDFVYGIKAAVETLGTVDSTRIRQYLESGIALKGVMGTYRFSSSSHTGLDASQVAMVELSSYTDPRSKGAIFFKRAER